MIRSSPCLASLAVSLAVILTGCASSPPTRFYTVKADSASSARYQGPPLRIAQIQIPAVLDRPQLVSESGSSELKIDEFSHWGAPLGQLIRMALIEDLQARSAPGRVLATGASAPNAVTLNVDILNVTNTGSSVAMHVVWTSTAIDMTSGSSRSVQTSHSDHFKVNTSATSPADYSEAISRLISQLADKMVAEH